VAHALSTKNFVDQIDILGRVDYDKMYEIAERASKDKSLFAEFDKDAAAAAKKTNGFTAPNGYHIHLVDEHNVYHPKEDDALTQISKAKNNKWSRVEIRAGKWNAACIICLWCS
jgi:hypothetical protein